MVPLGTLLQVCEILLVRCSVCAKVNGHNAAAAGGLGGFEIQHASASWNTFQAALVIILALQKHAFIFFLFCFLSTLIFSTHTRTAIIGLAVVVVRLLVWFPPPSFLRRDHSPRRSVLLFFKACCFSLHCYGSRALNGHVYFSSFLVPFFLSFSFSLD